MLIPLVVLSRGAIFSGMIWYEPFFGSHASVNAFFGLPAHAEATEEHAAEADAAAAEDHTSAPEAAPAGEQAVATEAAPAEDHAAAPAEGVAVAADEAAVAHGWETGGIFMAEDNHVIDDAHHAPAWVKASPFLAMLIGLGVAYALLHPEPEPARRRSRPQQRGLYLFLLNKWYFDELYDLHLRASRPLARPAPVEEGRRRDHRRRHQRARARDRARW